MRVTLTFDLPHYTSVSSLFGMARPRLSCFAVWWPALLLAARRCSSVGVAEDERPSYHRLFDRNVKLKLALESDGSSPIPAPECSQIKASPNYIECKVRISQESQQPGAIINVAPLVVTLDNGVHEPRRQFLPSDGFMMTNKFGTDEIRSNVARDAGEVDNGRFPVTSDVLLKTLGRRPCRCRLSTCAGLCTQPCKYDCLTPCLDLCSDNLCKKQCGRVCNKQCLRPCKEECRQSCSCRLPYWPVRRSSAIKTPIVEPINLPAAISPTPSHSSCSFKLPCITAPTLQCVLQLIGCVFKETLDNILDFDPQNTTVSPQPDSTNDTSSMSQPTELPQSKTTPNNDLGKADESPEKVKPENKRPPVRQGGDEDPPRDEQVMRENKESNNRRSNPFSALLHTADYEDPNWNSGPTFSQYSEEDMDSDPFPSEQDDYSYEYNNINNGLPARSPEFPHSLTSYNERNTYEIPNGKFTNGFKARRRPSDIYFNEFPAHRTGRKAAYPSRKDANDYFDPKDLPVPLHNMSVDVALGAYTHGLISKPVIHQYILYRLQQDRAGVNVMTDTEKKHVYKILVTSTHFYSPTAEEFRSNWAQSYRDSDSYES